MICATLEQAGYRVEAATSAEEALACYATAADGSLRFGAVGPGHAASYGQWTWPAGC